MKRTYSIESNRDGSRFALRVTRHEGAALFDFSTEHFSTAPTRAELRERVLRLFPDAEPEPESERRRCDHAPEFIIGSEFDQCRKCGAYLPTVYGSKRHARVISGTGNAGERRELAQLVRGLRSRD